MKRASGYVMELALRRVKAQAAADCFRKGPDGKNRARIAMDEAKRLDDEIRLELGYRPAYYTAGGQRAA